jgi:hypothetical protein
MSPGERVEHLSGLRGTVLALPAPEGFVAVHWDGWGPDHAAAIPVLHLTVLEEDVA